MFNPLSQAKSIGRGPHQTLAALTLQWKGISHALRARGVKITLQVESTREDERHAYKVVAIAPPSFPVLVVCENGHAPNHVSTDTSPCSWCPNQRYKVDWMAGHVAFFACVWIHGWLLEMFSYDQTRVIGRSLNKWSTVSYLMLYSPQPRAW